MEESEGIKNQVVTDTVNEDVKYEYPDEQEFHEPMISEPNAITQEDHDSDTPSCIECEVVWPEDTPPSSPKPYNSEMSKYNRTVSTQLGVSSPRSAHKIEAIPIESDLSLNTGKNSATCCSTKKFLYATPEYYYYECEHSPECRGNNHVSYTTKKKIPISPTKSKSSTKPITPTTSDKESLGGDSESNDLKYFKIIPIRHRQNSECPSYASGYESYSLKVEKLRNDMEAILSDWMLTVKNQVNENFYENVRKGFEAFIADVENYKKHKLRYPKSKAPSFAPPPPPSSCYSSNFKSSKSERKFDHPTPKTSSTSIGDATYGTALELVGRINQKLQNLIDMMEAYKEKMHLCKSSSSSEKSKHKSHDRKDKMEDKDVDEIIKYTVDKLKKYKTKHDSDKYKSDKHKSDKHECDKHKFDIYNYEKSKFDKLNSDKHKSDKYDHEKHKSDKHDHEKHKSDKHKSDKHKSDKHKKYEWSDESLAAQRAQICGERSKYLKKYDDYSSYKPEGDSELKFSIWMEKRAENEPKTTGTLNIDCCSYHKSKHPY